MNEDSPFLFSVQWSLLIDLYQKQKMLPAYSFPFQPYFLFPNLLSSGNSIIYHNNGPFVIQGFLPTNMFNAPISNQNAHAHPSIDSTPQTQPFFKLQALHEGQNQDLQKAQNRTVKEKLIKKAVNRPATYLTERKFYLAQHLPSQKNSQRSLRPRAQKKRSSKNKDTSPLSKQQKDSLERPTSRAFKLQEVTLKEELTHSKEKPSDFAALKAEHQEESQFQGEQQMKAVTQVRVLHIQEKQQ